MPGKTHHTAAAIVPPEEVWGPIQAIRRAHDRQVRRWPPHVNLLYPFRPASDFEAISGDLAEPCARLAPFTVTLAELELFRHGSGRCTLWLAPESAEALRSLQAALEERFPDCADVSRFPGGFTPHLSVGQLRGVEAPAVRERLRA